MWCWGGGALKGPRLRPVLGLEPQLVGPAPCRTAPDSSNLERRQSFACRGGGAGIGTRGSTF